MRITKKLRAYVERKKRFAKTVRELSNLSDRELHDIGIARCDIKFVAKETAVQD